jgi:4-hydroxy-tetrahydrodipicolinate reductase
MKIALLGYGKMGQAIETIAITRGHEIVLKKDRDDSFDNLESADVAIDFSLPQTAFEHINECFDKNIPIVCGTTGWLEKFDLAIENCKAKNGSFIYASNYSLGVNVFFELNNYLAKMMNNLKDYSVSMEEIHHTQKLDAPSGTAISLANDIIKNGEYNNWTLDKNDSEKNIFIDAKRIENIPGTHSVFYDSKVDQIEIKHTAHNREGFALGAVIAAEYIHNKKGIFNMKDVLGI